MIHLYLYIIIIILILFLMYVYKKKCDEDYYISLIRFTQQQCQYNNFPQKQYNYIPSLNYPIYNPRNFCPNYNQINCNDGYHTPKRRKNFQVYKNFSDPSPSQNVNFTNNQFIREKIVLNNINKEYDNQIDHKFFEQNKNINGNINKKIFKLEDFFTDSK